MSEELVQNRASLHKMEHEAVRLLSRAHMQRHRLLSDLRDLRCLPPRRNDTEDDHSESQETLDLANATINALLRDVEDMSFQHKAERTRSAEQAVALRKEHIAEKSALSDQIRYIEEARRREIAEITRQRDDLRRLCLDHQSQSLAIQSHYSNIDEDVQSTRQEIASLKENTRMLEARRQKTVRNLLLGLLVLWRLIHQLGFRLSDAVHVKSVVLTRFKSLSNKKIEARRLYLRANNLNQDLQAQLILESTKRTEEAAAAQKWHSEYYRSVKAREKAALKFKAFQRFAVQRFSGTVSKLLAALLVLWQHNAILGPHLAGPQALVRALQNSALESDEHLANAAADDEVFQTHNLSFAPQIALLRPPQMFSYISHEIRASCLPTSKTASTAVRALLSHNI